MVKTIMNYNFDNRLLDKSFTLSMDNYADGFVKLNGIYYRVTTTEKLIWGDEVVIVAVQGNAISLEKETSKNDIS
ncbi:NfeD family protein [Weissella sagaensis]|jgi:membrane protein implicated in regulation of membrane protease activity|nr:hypothetical protein [Weissella sagaensis]KAA8434695.1 hypothetical protein FKV79_02345 [Weissella paramesenteroides]QDJ59412.1 hypothetical protein EFA59_07780 [Weissella hellenica]KAA8437654.1 hypothetical protein FKV73_06550 [Weissella paramesenteroides]QEA56725.1 hypothetical protein FGL75_01970 [Weissella hellenica]UEG67536.1 hypothetical protein GZH44_03220 [Weissella hellenica]